MSGTLGDRDTNWEAIAGATAEMLCASYQRHKPYHDGVYACDRCRVNARNWTHWVQRGTEKVAGKRDPKSPFLR